MNKKKPKCGKKICKKIKNCCNKDFSSLSNYIYVLECIKLIRKQLSENNDTINEIKNQSPDNNTNYTSSVTSLSQANNHIKEQTENIEAFYQIPKEFRFNLKAFEETYISENQENIINKINTLEIDQKKLDKHLDILSNLPRQQYLKNNIKALKKQRRCIIERQILLFILLVLPGFLFFFTDNQCKTTIQTTKNNTLYNCCDIKSNNCKHCNACPHCHMFDFICDFVCDNHNICRSNKCICCPRNNKCSYEICETNSKHSLCRWQKFVIIVWIIILVCIIVWCIFRLPSLYRKNKRIDAIITKINTGYYRSIEEFRRDLDSALKQ